MTRWLRIVCLVCCAALPMGTACQRPAPVVRARAPGPAMPTRPLSLCERPAKAPVHVPDATMNTSFRSFAEGWIVKMRNANPSGTTRRRIHDALETELKPTGSTAAPYVGILRYCDQTLHCTGAAATTCQPSKSTVVTEIFRFQGGKWVY